MWSLLSFSILTKKQGHYRADLIIIYVGINLIIPVVFFSMISIKNAGVR